MLHTEFEKLPPLVRGESKDVRLIDDDRVAIRFLPTVYSFTHNRCGEVPGTAELRVRSSEILTKVLSTAGLDHAYESFHGDIVVAKKVDPPPIEIIVKGRHLGTPKHRYFGMNKYPTRHGNRIEVGERYPRPWVRFDWRNPLRHPDTKDRLADEVLGEDLADEFIDVARSKATALRAWTAMHLALARVGIELVDICLFLDVTGTLIFGELSPDCARFRYQDRDLDKDVWRKGGDSQLVLDRWREFVDRVEAL